MEMRQIKRESESSRESLAAAATRDNLALQQGDDTTWLRKFQPLVSWNSIWAAGMRVSESMFITVLHPGCTTCVCHAAETVPRCGRLWYYTCSTSTFNLVRRRPADGSEIRLRLCSLWLYIVLLRSPSARSLAVGPGPVVPPQNINLWPCSVHIRFPPDHQKQIDAVISFVSLSDWTFPFPEGEYFQCLDFCSLSFLKTAFSVSWFLEYAPPPYFTSTSYFYISLFQLKFLSVSVSKVWESILELLHFQE